MGMIGPRKTRRELLMDKRTLGEGLEVSAIGLGCMGMSQSFPPIPIPPT